MWIMKFLECLPFVRFAYKICFKSNTPAVAKDCRLFYVTDGEGTIVIDIPLSSLMPLKFL